MFNVYLYNQCANDFSFSPVGAMSTDAAINCPPKQKTFIGSFHNGEPIESDTTLADLRLTGIDDNTGFNIPLCAGLTANENADCYLIPMPIKDESNVTITCAG